MLGACTPAQAMLHSLPQLASRAVPRAYLQSRLPASSLTQLRQRAQIAAMADVETFQLAQGKTLLLSQGDITEYDGDALVNAANERMLGGGGVDGAIHRAAGSELYDLCKAVPEEQPGVRCPTGQARITEAGDLEVKYVIHTVGPVYDEQSDDESQQLLRSCHVESLRLANEKSCKSVAFPAISCGVYGYPPAKAAKVALKACAEHMGDVESVHFVLFSKQNLATFKAEAEEQFQAA